MVFPFFKFSFKNKQQHAATTANSPVQNAKTRGRNNTVIQTISNGPPPLTEEQLEHQRRNQLVSQLRDQWLLSHDNITPARMAGPEWGQGEQEWVNQQLEVSGETWRV